MAMDRQMSSWTPTGICPDSFKYRFALPAGKICFRSDDATPLRLDFLFRYKKAIRNLLIFPATVSTVYKLIVLVNKQISDAFHGLMSRLN